MEHMKRNVSFLKYLLQPVTFKNCKIQLHHFHIAFNLLEKLNSLSTSSQSIESIFRYYYDIPFATYHKVLRYFEVILTFIEIGTIKKSHLGLHISQLHRNLKFSIKLITGYVFHQPTIPRSRSLAH